MAAIKTTILLGMGLGRRLIYMLFKYLLYLSNIIQAGRPVFSTYSKNLARSPVTVNLVPSRVAWDKTEGDWGSLASSLIKTW